MDSARQQQDIIVQIAKNFRGIEVSPSKLRKLVKAICTRFALSKATVSIAIVDDAEIRRLNKRFLNRNRPTDCLSFDLSDDGSTADRKSKIKNQKSFELVVNGEKALREAHLRGHSAEAELALYITHSLLHNLGFDDSTQPLARKIHQAEDEILQQQGFGSVYNTDKR
jgi:probable rRNA maturation factor